jgi:protein-tyrosine phosphatase
MRFAVRRSGSLSASLVALGFVALLSTAAVPPALAASGGRGGVAEASVERTSDGLVVSWETRKGRVREIEWGEDPAQVDRPLVASVPKGQTSVTVADPSPGTRPYVALVTDDGRRTVVAERRIPLTGDANFRDLGGYETADGRRVRWGQIYRSGALDKLTDADLATLQSLDVKLVCDLRSPTEVQAAPDKAIPGAESVAIPMFDRSVDPQAIREAVLAGDVAALGTPGSLLVEGNRKFVTDFTDDFAQVMERVMDPDYRPATVHCSGGKDRAGLTSALVLLTLGVPRETVIQDYLLSNTYRGPENAQTVERLQAILDPQEVEVVKSLIEVRPEYLQAAFDTMEEEYGSVDAYLRKGLGISNAERKRFQQQMLERG